MHVFYCIKTATAAAACELDLLQLYNKESRVKIRVPIGPTSLRWKKRRLHKKKNF